MDLIRFYFFFIGIQSNKYVEILIPQGITYISWVTNHSLILARNFILSLFRNITSGIYAAIICLYYDPQKGL